MIETGQGVPEKFKGKKVTVYRSLKSGKEIVGTWSEYAHLHYLQCAILPDNVDAEAYSGSLVNIITPYAFWKQAEQEGHKGIICTAGNSATGITLLGICLVNNFPIISIVRNEAGKKELEALGAKNIVAQSDANYKQQLGELAQQLNATTVFDGVGGAILNEIINVIPFGSAIYCYGFLGGQTPFSFHTRTLMNLTAIKGFSNFKSATVQDPKQLEQALDRISNFIDMPHFQTKTGKKFSFEEVNDALQYKDDAGGKAILKP